MPYGLCKAATWVVDELVSAMDPQRTARRNAVIEIPRFQRTLVWSAKQESGFIDSLKKGFPFGSLLLFRKGSQDGIEFYSLIDGLQRANTLRRYSQNPNRFFDKGEVDEAICHRILSFVGASIDDTAIDTMKEQVVEWIRERRSFEEQDGYSAYNLVKYLTRDVYGTHPDLDDPEYDRLLKDAARFLSSVREKSDISRAEVPLMIYSGDAGDLPEIFDRINSSGTKLNKYQVFAATWSGAFYSVSDNEIVSLVKTRYEDAEKKGFAIEGYDPAAFGESGFTLFEYLFGFGKLLKKKYPGLFGAYDEQESDQVDSIGFNLVTACLGLSPQDMGLLPDKISEEGPEEVGQGVLESVDFVWDCLKPLLSLRLNQKKKRVPLGQCHTEFQMVSIVALVHRLKASPEYCQTWHKHQQILKKTIPQWYLYDIISENWRGAGDTRIKQIYDSGSEARYLRPVKVEQWDSALDNWFGEQLSSGTVKRATPKPAVHLFLNYIYTQIVSYYAIQTTEFELEHLIPLARLQEANTTTGDSFAASIVGNLAFLDKPLNRRKSDLTIAEFYKREVEKGHLSPEDAASRIAEYKAFVFQDPSEIYIPPAPDGSDHLSREFYEDFVRKRFALLKERFYSYYVRN